MIPLICCQRTANGFPCSQGFSRSLLLPITSITLRTDEYKFIVQSHQDPVALHFVQFVSKKQIKLNRSQHVTLMFKWQVYRCSNYTDVRRCHPKECNPFSEIDTFDTSHVKNVGKGPHVQFPFLSLGFLTRAMLLRCLMEC